jgi:hypothetical protein
MTDLHELEGAVVFESGLVLENQDALRYLSESVRTFNAMTGATLVLTPAPGAEPTRAFLLNKALSALEERAMILLAILMWLDGMARKFSFQAIKHTNAAGSTSMDGIEFAISKRAKELRDKVTGELTGIMDALTGGDVLAGVGHSELGESLPGTWGYPYPYNYPYGPYGYYP